MVIMKSSAEITGQLSGGAYQSRQNILEFDVLAHLPTESPLLQIINNCICICFDGVVIAAQFTVTVLRSIVIPQT